MSRATFTERASPSTPSTGKASLFVKTDKGIYLIDDTGLETQLLRTASALTAGGVVFASGAGVLANDPTKLFWDDTNNRLGIGTNTPNVALDVVGTLAVTKTTAGDSGIFTNGGASNKSVYVYTDDTYAGLFSTANAAGNAYYWNGTTDTHHWQINGLGSRMNLSSTGLAVTGSGSFTTLSLDSGGATPLPLTMNSTVANGTYFTVKNSGTEIGWIGAAKQTISGGLSASDFGIAAAAGGTLYLGDLGTNTVAISDSSVSVTGALSATGAITSNAGLGANAYFATGSNYAELGTTTNHPLSFFTNNTTKMTLDASGNLTVAAGYIAGAEQTAPSAPAANGYRIFAQDNGAGKTQLMVIFASGAAQQLAIEP